MTTITITGDTMTIDGGLAGSVSDAAANFPAYTTALWAAINLQNKALTQNNSDLAAALNALQAQYNALANISNNPRVISPEAFRMMFTPTQFDAIIEISRTDNTVMKLLIIFCSNEMVHLDDSTTKNGLLHLQAIGIISDLSIF